MKGYWFKAKLYGWGWTPATWQGWLVVVLFVLSLLSVSENAPSQGTAIIGIFLLILLLFLICFIKGEKPRWRWGSRKS